MTEQPNMPLNKDQQDVSDCADATMPANNSNDKHLSTEPSTNKKSLVKSSLDEKKLDKKVKRKKKFL